MASRRPRGRQVSSKYMSPSPSSSTSTSTVSSSASSRICPSPLLSRSINLASNSTPVRGDQAENSKPSDQHRWPARTRQLSLGGTNNLSRSMDCSSDNRKLSRIGSGIVGRTLQQSMIDESKRASFDGRLRLDLGNAELLKDARQNPDANSAHESSATPYLSSFLPWSFEQSTGKLQIAYRHTGVSASNWVAWAINPDPSKASAAMPGAQALVAWPQSGGTPRVYKSPIQSYSTNLAEGNLTYEVTDSTAMASITGRAAGECPSAILQSICLVAVGEQQESSSWRGPALLSSRASFCTKSSDEGSRKQIQCVDRVIYLDSDVVVVDDIHKLWNMSLTGSRVIGAPEYCHANFTKYFIDGFWSDPILSRVFSSRNPCYFNTGVMVMDLVRWREGNYRKRIENWMELQRKRRIYELGSLPPFLLVFAGNVEAIDHRWNQHGLGGDNVRGSCRSLHPGPVSLLHWSGKGKPWVRLKTKNPCPLDHLWVPHMIIIDNLEKGLSPSTIMEFIHQQLSISCQAFVSPSKLLEIYA